MRAKNPTKIIQRKDFFSFCFAFFFFIFPIIFFFHSKIRLVFNPESSETGLLRREHIFINITRGRIFKSTPNVCLIDSYF